MILGNCGWQLEMGMNQMLYIMHKSRWQCFVDRELQDSDCLSPLRLPKQNTVDRVASTTET